MVISQPRGSRWCRYLGMYCPVPLGLQHSADPRAKRVPPRVRSCATDWLGDDWAPCGCIKCSRLAQKQKEAGAAVGCNSPPCPALLLSLGCVPSSVWTIVVTCNCGCGCMSCCKPLLYKSGSACHVAHEPLFHKSDSACQPRCLPASHFPMCRPLCKLTYGAHHFPVCQGKNNYLAASYCTVSCALPTSPCRRACGRVNQHTSFRSA